jgi:hypothetical protein
VGKNGLFGPGEAALFTQGLHGRSLLPLCIDPALDEALSKLFTLIVRDFVANWCVGFLLF